MMKHAEDKPEYTWLREFKSIHGMEFQRRCGAHSIGIGWKKVGGKKTDQLALIFYVERKCPPEKIGSEPVPPTITFTPSNADKTVYLKTDVIESVPATFEGKERGHSL